jgi:hypothetical protein
MKHTNKFNKSILTLALITTIGAATNLQAIDQQTLKIKDFYINRIAINSADALNLERIGKAGGTLLGLSVAAGPLGAGGVILAGTILTLASLAYGPETLATFVAVKRLEEMIKKEPELLTFMSKSDRKVFDNGKAVADGRIATFINKLAAKKTAIKEAAQLFITQNPDLTTDMTEETLLKTVATYLAATTTIKTYEATRQQEAEARKNLKAGLLTPAIKAALAFVDSFIAEPLMKQKINDKKKAIANLLKKYPEMSDVESALQKTTDELMQRFKEIKEQYAR